MHVNNYIRRYIPAFVNCRLKYQINEINCPERDYGISFYAVA